MSENIIEGWCIVELMGHRKLAGKVTTIELGGQVLLRLDVPNGESFTTQFYNPSALYCLTPCSEEIARRFADRVQPEPVHQWEMQLLPAEAPPAPSFDDHGDIF